MPGPVEITDATTFSLSLSVLLAIGAVVSSWVTLRARVQRHDERHDECEEDVAKLRDRVESLERWRERERGAEYVRRGDTDRIVLTDTGQHPRQ